MQPSQASAARQQRRVLDQAGHANAYGFFNLLSGVRCAKLPIHSCRPQILKHVENAPRSYRLGLVGATRRI